MKYGPVSARARTVNPSLDRLGLPGEVEGRESRLPRSPGSPLRGIASDVLLNERRRRRSRALEPPAPLEPRELSGVLGKHLRRPAVVGPRVDVVEVEDRRAQPAGEHPPRTSVPLQRVPTGT